MKGLFSYDNKVMQLIMKFADIAILNVLFLVCSLPIVTMGAAISGLCTGFRVMLDPEDDSSTSAAFFRGFKNGFLIITPVWCIMLLITAVVGYCCATIYFLKATGVNGPVILSLISLSVALVLTTLVPIFHSRFSCTRRQLVKNSWYLLLFSPIRSIVSVALLWFPVIVFLWDAFVFMSMTPIFLVIWYGFAGLFVVSLMKKPMTILEDGYYEQMEEEELTEEEQLEIIAEHQLAELTLSEETNTEKSTIGFGGGNAPF